ncbi:MAG: electron transporter RnfG, partial [Spirochaetes bacterium]
NDFKGQFEGIRTNPAAYYVKNKEPDNNNTVQAITGATISSMAVVSIINEAVQRLKQVLKQGS